MAASRLVALAPGECEHEWMMEYACSDGLPVVPPTPGRVSAMLAVSHLPPSAVLGKCAPSYFAVTVEDAAVSAVMAGCAPAHFPVVLATLTAALTPRFNLHGNHATTMGCTPCVVVSGPLGKAAGLNGGLGCLGSGHRANATIGRALKLVLHRVGGARLGGSESSTLGSPAKYTFCFAENDEARDALGPWKPYHVDLSGGGSGGGVGAEQEDGAVVGGQRFSALDSCVTVHPTVGFTTIVDFYTATPDALVDWLASSVVGGWGRKMPVLSSGLLVLCPEHYELLSRKFKTRRAFQV